MYQVRILQSIAGFRPKAILSFDDLPSDVRAWVEIPCEDGSYRAELVETATVAPMETAMKRGKRR